MFIRSHLLQCSVIFLVTICSIPGHKSFGASPVIGDAAPAFEGTALDGQKISLDTLHGDVIIVNFWASWCAPCIKELPLLEGYLEARKGNGLRIVAVITDADKLSYKSKKELGNLSISFVPRLHGPYSLIDKKLPTNYIIDRTGVLRYAEAGALDLDKMNNVLVPLLNESPSLPASPPNIQ